MQINAITHRCVMLFLTFIFIAHHFAFIFAYYCFIGRIEHYTKVRLNHHSQNDFKLECVAVALFLTLFGCIRDDFQQQFNAAGALASLLLLYILSTPMPSAVHCALVLRVHVCNVRKLCAHERTAEMRC